MRQGSSKTRMKRSTIPFLGGLVALLLLAAASASGSAEPVSEPILGHLTDGGPLSFSFGVVPLRPQLVVPAAASGGQAAEDGRATDVNAQVTAVSFDLKLRWPGTGAMSPLEPYIAIGPALFLLEPDSAANVPGTRVDPSLRLGAKAGGGLNWRLGKATTLFGAYEVTTAGESSVGPLGARSPSDPVLHGYDFTYGLRFRY
jgi:hypothetical protein